MWIFSIMYFISLNAVRIFSQLIWHFAKFDSAVCCFIWFPLMMTSSPGCLVLFYVMLMTLYLRTCFVRESLKPRMRLLFLTKSSAFAFSSLVSPNLEPLSIRYTALISQNYSGSVNLSWKFMVTTSQGRIFFSCSKYPQANGVPAYHGKGLLLPSLPWAGPGIVLCPDFPIKLPKSKHKCSLLVNPLGVKVILRFETFFL